MKAQLKMVHHDFFYEPVTHYPALLPLAGEMVEVAKQIPPGVSLLLSERPLATELATMTPEQVVHLIPPEKMPLAHGILIFLRHLGSEIRRGFYFLETFIQEIEKLPPFASGSKHQFSVFQNLREKGCRFSDLPEDFDKAKGSLLQLSREIGVSLEYLIGNLEKALKLLKLVGVRDLTLNLSNLFHNYRSGFFRLDLEAAAEVEVSQLLTRAVALQGKGVSLEIFAGGKFNAQVSALETKNFEDLMGDVEENYACSPGEFAKFVDAIITAEEKRLEAAPILSLRELLSCFKFSTLDKDVVALPAVVQQDDPLRWKQTKLGQALLNLRKNLNWLAVSAGIKAAGDLPLLQENKEIEATLESIKKLAGGFSITLFSGRQHKLTEPKISDLTPEEILFDLYCLAVLEKRSLDEVLNTTRGVLEFIPKLENHDPIVNLNALIASRLAGESYVTLLGTQGLVLRNAPLVAALEKLRALENKVNLFVRSTEGTEIPIGKIGIEEFRRAIILLGRWLKPHHSPERILGIINDKIAPEISRLPTAVIAAGSHDLGRLVDLALAGIPPRYPLRRPWKKLNLDPLVSLGNCLEPGVRNCLGCPVNTLYGLVMKTALSLGFEEILTYEATGCFEVYSGIWPYTGKLYPSLHGVFGAAPSEMLGGLAAKRARARFDLKNGKVPPTHLSRVLHLGWGGDGATFDIGFGNLSGLFSRLQKITADELEKTLQQRALYVCYDNEGYQNTGNQYSGASSPGGDTTTNPKGKTRPLGNDIRKKPMVEIIAEHGVPFSARLNIHRQEHITRVVARALEDGDQGSFIHFLQPCTTGWKFSADNLTYDLSSMAEEGGLFSPVSIEHGVPFLETYPTPRNPGDAFLKLQARFKHLLGPAHETVANLEKVLEYYRTEWQRNLILTGFEGEVSQADRLGYLEDEHRISRVS